jgi:hypothetical protein
VAVLAYTFRTHPAIEELKLMFPDLFVFSSLKKDLLVFEAIVEATKPRLIIGVADTKGNSVLESKAINKFNSDKTVSKEGPDFYLLATPESVPFNISQKSTDSFCNWTMYRIADYLAKNGKETKLAFCHVNAKDIAKLNKIS